ncbi:hypothetical protein BDW71DRAFT_187379 [Aspergillus fruticulosus]
MFLPMGERLATTAGSDFSISSKRTVFSTSELLDQLLVVYRGSLRRALELKAGALQVLETLKACRKKVIVVIEGPKDAQKWTVAALGLEQYINILVTTNEVGLSKVDGLFSAVLQQYCRG